MSMPQEKNYAPLTTPMGCASPQFCDPNPIVAYPMASASPQFYTSNPQFCAPNPSVVNPNLNPMASAPQFWDPNPTVANLMYSVKPQPCAANPSVANPNPNPNASAPQFWGPNPIAANPMPSVSPQICAPNNPIGANHMVVVSPQFCAPNPIDLAIVRKFWTMSEGNFGVTDVNGNPMFKVKGHALTFNDKRVLLDNAGYPIITLRQKIFSAHSRWQAFSGDSSGAKDLIFSAKTSSMFQFKTKLDVFMANNTTEQICDFKVKGSWSERSCVIYAGESSNVIAQMHKKHTVQSVLLGKDKFMVTVYPHVDHAFIVALIVILDEINDD